MGKMHHLDVGCADASILESNGEHFLVDTHGIDKHSALLPSSGRIKAVFITHQHYDHYDGLQFLKDSGYAIEYLICSPYERRRGDNSVDLDEWNTFIALRDSFASNGTKLYHPYRQNDWSKPYWENAGLKFWMLGPDKDIACSESRELHDASLVLLVIATASKRRCLYTGDASDTSLRYIADHTTHICDDILRVSHHGSLNGADLEFIKKCSAKYCVISTASGVHDNVPHPTALKRYADHTEKEVYRTDVFGTVTWTI